nr:hypothetical protein [Tanacetum cinerariifolium]
MHNAFNQQYGYRLHMSPLPNPIPSQSSQHFSPLNSLDIEDDEFTPLFGKGPSQPIVQDSLDESLVEEVALVKQKFVRKRQPAKQNDKDVNEPWTPDEEAALCKAWINTSENNKDGNGKNTNGFWMEVTTYFHKETGSAKRNLESINYKWKNQIVLRKKVEYPMYFKAKYLGSKKSRTLESASDSAHNGLNLNDEAANLGDEEIEESRPMGQDKTKRMGSTFAARSTSLVVADPSLVDVLLSKFTQCVAPLFSSRKEASFEYVRIKEQELELERLKLVQAEKFKEQKLAQRDRELAMQEKMFQLQQEEKWEKDIIYYNESHEHLTGKALSTALLLKKKIKER